MTLHYRMLPDSTGFQTSPLMGADLHGLGAVPLAPYVDASTLPATAQPYAVNGKRVLDVVLSLVALILAAPILVLLALALWIEGGNPFYSQVRLGMNGRRFRMWKLRTMVQDADMQLAGWLARDPQLRAEWELTQKLKNDPRITRLGRLLRKTSMDELPQVFNVLRGDMSLVGPRPMLPEQMPLYLNPAAYLALRPGLTGLWQITARNEESFDLRAVLDLRYAQRLSFALDLRIILGTFAVIWRATGY